MFSVSNIVIEGGRFEFVDRLKKSHQEISEIRIGIPFIANFENDEEKLGRAAFQRQGQWRSDLDLKERCVPSRKIAKRRSNSN